MANALKILGQLNPTANTQGNVYVVPASTSAVINNITVANQTAANVSYSIIVMPSVDIQQRQLTHTLWFVVVSYLPLILHC